MSKRAARGERVAINPQPKLYCWQSRVAEDELEAAVAHPVRADPRGCFEQRYLWRLVVKPSDVRMGLAIGFPRRSKLITGNWYVQYLTERREAPSHIPAGYRF